MLEPVIQQIWVYEKSWQIPGKELPKCKAEPMGRRSHQNAGSLPFLSQVSPALGRAWEYAFVASILGASVGWIERLLQGPSEGNPWWTPPGAEMLQLLYHVQLSWWVFLPSSKFITSWINSLDSQARLLHFQGENILKGAIRSTYSVPPEPHVTTKTMAPSLAPVATLTDLLFLTIKGGRVMPCATLNGKQMETGSRPPSEQKKSTRGL